MEKCFKNHGNRCVRMLRLQVSFFPVYKIFAHHTVFTTLLRTYFLKSDYTRVRFITTYFLAELNAKLSLKAQEVIDTDLAERREMCARKLYGDKLPRNSLQWLVLTRCAGSNQRGGFAGGEQVPEGLGLLAKDSWAVQEPLHFPEQGTRRHWGWRQAQQFRGDSHSNSGVKSRLTKAEKMTDVKGKGEPVRVPSFKG